MVEAFSATIDTTAWLLLLLLFELETAVLPDDKLRGRLKWTLMAIRGVCYFFIVYAFYGYWVKFLLITGIEPFAVADLCGLVGSEWNYVVDLDDYPPLDAEACAAMQGQPLYRISGTEILGTREALDSMTGDLIDRFKQLGEGLPGMAELKSYADDRFQRANEALRRGFQAQKDRAELRFLPTNR